MDIHPVENAPLISSSTVAQQPLIADDNNNHNHNILLPSSTTTNNDLAAVDNDNNDLYFPNPNLFNPTALETIKWWAEFTSIHGMYYIFERGHFQRWKKLAWSIVVISCTISLLIAIRDEFNSYTEYNVDTNTKTIIPTSLSFPKVTLCNANGGIDATLQHSTGIIEPKNEEELVLISQPLTEFILKTQFNNQVYASRDELMEVWTPVITQVGQCFEFVTNEKVFYPGINAGMLVYTWLNQSSYPDSTEWAGINVLVGGNSNNSNNDLVIASPVLVPPGAVSFISLTKQEIQREENKPLNCIPGGNTVDACRMICIMEATKEMCGCRIMGDDDTTLDYCNSSNDECRNSMNDDDILSICQTCAYPPLPPCKEQTYTTSYSAGRISQKKIEEAKQLTSSATGSSMQGQDYNELSNNLAVIHINFASIQYIQTTETKSTSTWQLFSNLGGSFGFFMGISIISIVEFFVELIGLRLVPRLWGRNELYGIGQKKDKFD